MLRFSVLSICGISVTWVTGLLVACIVTLYRLPRVGRLLQFVFSLWRCLDNTLKRWVLLVVMLS